ncbi:hypothetical protein D9M73_201980 [compost metagenome]
MRFSPSMANSEAMAPLEPKDHWILLSTFRSIPVCGSLNDAEASGFNSFFLTWEVLIFQVLLVATSITSMPGS